MKWLLFISAISLLAACNSGDKKSSSPTKKAVDTTVTEKIPEEEHNYKAISFTDAFNPMNDQEYVSVEGYFQLPPPNILGFTYKSKFKQEDTYDLDFYERKNQMNGPKISTEIKIGNDINCMAVKPRKKADLKITDKNRKILLVNERVRIEGQLRIYEYDFEGKKYSASIYAKNIWNWQ